MGKVKRFQNYKRRVVCGTQFFAAILLYPAFLIKTEQWPLIFYTSLEVRAEIHQALS
jgi:hypothetical protein